MVDRKTVEDHNLSQVHEAQFTAFVRVAQALAEGGLNEHNVIRLHRTINSQTNAQIAALPPEMQEAMNERIQRLSGGERSARMLP